MNETRHTERRARRGTARRCCGWMRAWIICTAMAIFGLPGLGANAGQPGNEDTPKTAPPGGAADPNSSSRSAVRVRIEEEYRLAETLLRDFPDRDEPLTLMGNLYRRRGNSVKAIDYWEKAIAKNPNLATVYQSLGMLAFEKDEFQTSVDMWRKALKLNSSLAGIRNQLGDALMNLGRYDEAVGILDEELRSNPQSASTYYFLGRAHFQMQHYDPALACYEKAVALQADHTKAHYGLSSIYARRNEPEKARESMALFRKYKVRDDEALARIDQADHEMANATEGLLDQIRSGADLYLSAGKFDTAERLLQRGLELDPNNIGCLERLALVYQSQKRNADALALFLKVRDIQPGNPICFLNLGSVYSQLRRFEEAQAAYQKVIELMPKESKGYSELARLYLRAGRNPSAALGLAQVAVDLEGSAENYWLLSWAQDTNGNRGAAIGAIEQAVRLSPDNEKYLKTRNQLTGRTK
jgi:tetratricopeptide (TPR) repeat protein